MAHVLDSISTEKLWRTNNILKRRAKAELRKEILEMKQQGIIEFKGNYKEIYEEETMNEIEEESIEERKFQALQRKLKHEVFGPRSIWYIGFFDSMLHQEPKGTLGTLIPIYVNTHMEQGIKTTKLEKQGKEDKLITINFKPEFNAWHIYNTKGIFEIIKEYKLNLEGRKTVRWRHYTWIHYNTFTGYKTAFQVKGQYKEFIREDLENEDWPQDQEPDPKGNVNYWQLQWDLANSHNPVNDKIFSKRTLIRNYKNILLILYKRVDRQSLLLRGEIENKLHSGDICKHLHINAFVAPKVEEEHYNRDNIATTLLCEDCHTELDRIDGRNFDNVYKLTL